MHNTSREHTPPDHGLRVLVRIDTRQGRACLEVRGCLTPDTCSTLMNILAHTGGLGAAVSVNLLRAAHVDAGALALLLDSADDAVHTDPERASTAPVEILVPPVLPVCQSGPVSGPAAPTAPDLPVSGTRASGLSAPGTPAFGLTAPGRPLPGRALTNEEAAELAFMLRDPKVIAQPPHFRPHAL